MVLGGNERDDADLALAVQSLADEVRSACAEGGIGGSDKGVARRVVLDLAVTGDHRNARCPRLGQHRLDGLVVDRVDQDAGRRWLGDGRLDQCDLLLHVRVERPDQLRLHSQRFCRRVPAGFAFGVERVADVGSHPDVIPVDAATGSLVACVAAGPANTPSTTRTAIAMTDLTRFCILVPPSHSYRLVQRHTIFGRHAVLFGGLPPSHYRPNLQGCCSAAPHCSGNLRRGYPALSQSIGPDGDQHHDAEDTHLPVRRYV